MSPDDPRHGTTRGFHAGCRCPACRKALARDEKRRRLDKLSGGRAIPAIGAQRRIQALMALGWTSNDIANAVGLNNRNDILRVLNGQKGKPCNWIERATHQRIKTVYDRLSMQLPTPAPHRARTRAIAARKGYAPPLAWDNIDDPNAVPQGHIEVGRTTEARNTRASEVEHLIWMGETMETACEALGISKDGLWRWCKAHGHLDLYKRLGEQTPVRAENQFTKRGAA